MVYVIAKDGTPLMPCRNVIARLLLKQHRAKVKRREPFTIKLTKLVKKQRPFMGRFYFVSLG